MGCGGKIKMNEWIKHFTSSVAVYCMCCSHKFVCMGCYIKDPNSSMWLNMYGPTHNPIDMAAKTALVLESIENDKGVSKSGSLSKSPKDGAPKIVVAITRK